MTKMIPSHLATRYQIMPNLTSGTVYRQDATDTIIAVYDVTQIEKRPDSKTEGPSLEGAGLTPISRVYHAWVGGLNGWVPALYDVLAVDGEFWSIRTERLTLADTRYELSCVKTRPLP
jgi:hypothetical protein